jgi:hypothetical protein
MYHIANTVLVQDSVDSDTNKEAIVNVFEEFIGCAVSSSITSLTCTFELFTLLLIMCFKNQIRKDSIVKSLNKAINPSLNTNPFNHNTNYIKLYDFVKEGTSNKDEYGQLINPRYLDDVFNFKTSLPPLTRKVRIELGKKENLVMKNVQVWDYSNVNRALGKTATQSSTYDSEYAWKAVDTDPNSYSHTTNKEFAWWEVDLGAEYTVKNVTILNRNDKWGNYGTKLTGGNVILIDNAGQRVGRYNIKDGSPIELFITFGFTETATGVAAWKSPSPTGEPLLSDGCKTQLKHNLTRPMTSLTKQSLSYLETRPPLGRYAPLPRDLRQIQ